jgi:hypothetical protein
MPPSASFDVRPRRPAYLFYVWCVMPDHVHLVLGASPTCDIVTFVGRFKNLTQREAWRFGVEGAFWQTSFWDHFIRDDERIETVVEYVLSNPVRSGLVERWWDYRFSGSIVFEIVDRGGGQAPALRSRAADSQPVLPSRRGGT